MTIHELFDQWTTYEKVVDNDYMHHRAYVARLIDYLRDRVTSPISILDLGCGDAKPVAPLLDAFEVIRYVGVDESAEALARARRTLESFNLDLELIETSMEDASPRGKFDLIVASYSLHHLDRADKQKMMAWCLDRLKPCGVVAVIDVFMEPGEQRTDYLDRWEQNARSDWTGLSPAEVSELVNHVRSSDKPEQLSDYERLAQASGFGVVSELMHGPDKLNKLIVLEAQQ